MNAKKHKAIRKVARAIVAGRDEDETTALAVNLGLRDLPPAKDARRALKVAAEDRLRSLSGGYSR